jgi:protoheme IX farnesyltransferase
VSDYWKLLRPGILGMTLVAMAVAAWIAAPQPPAWPDLLHGLFGTALVIAGAIVLNQRLESRGDAKMPRTADRPLPAGKLTRRQVTWLGLTASVAGLVYLAIFSQPMVVVLAAASWVIYVWLYTPLKSRSPWQTPVGALAGAMPVLLGAAVAGAMTSPMAWVLFAVLYFWQLPHSMAIAWLYRHQFADAGVRLVSVVDPSGRAAGRVAVAGSIVLLTVSLVPAMMHWTEWPYNLGALLLGHAYMACSFGFLRSRSDLSARWLLRASLIYLPALFAALLL